MFNKITKKMLPVILSFVLLITIGVVYSQIKAAGNDPGSIADPLVTKSYVDEMHTQLLAEVTEMIALARGSGGTTTPNNMTDIYKYIDDKIAVIAKNGVSVTTGFNVVELNAGQKLICEASTELILRSGEAQAIANAAGDGLTDATAGRDIKGGEVISGNHLLIVPRSDGRGLSVNKKSFIMVKGNYTIQ